jgi:hypothetical protein
VQGESYEYMGLDELKVKRLAKFLEAVPNKEKIEFFECSKIKIDSLR